MTRLIRLVNPLLVALSITLLTLVVLDALLPGFALSNARSALVGIFVLGIINYAILPLAIRVTLPFDYLTFGLIPLLLNGLAVFVVSRLVPGFEVHDVVTGLLVSFGLTFNHLLITNSYVFRREHDELEYFELSRLSQKKDASNSTPGLILLEIDGLAEPLLRQAIDAGYMPTLDSWLRNGTHQLACWETGLPSQTSSMQAGILHGNHYNIPAFRFYDRNRKVILVSNNPNYAPDILNPLLNGQGLLRDHGYSLNNWATGDAPEVVLTFAALEKDVVKQSHELYVLFARAYAMQRVVVSMIWDAIIEVMEAFQQKIHQVQPRVERHFPYPLIRAASTCLLPYLNAQLTTSKLFEGIESAYVTFPSYDEVAHHSGIDRPETFQVLRQIDEEIRFISGATRHTQRPYEFIILSDHGQSMGATFKQRFGLTLAELVDSAAGRGQKSLTTPTVSAEGIGYVRMLFSAIIAPDNRDTGVLNRLFRKPNPGKGRVKLTQPQIADKRKSSPSDAKTVVCASGNLAHIYFADHNKGLSLEEIDAAYPQVVKTLINHPGISFIAVRSKERGSLAKSKNGTYYLETNRIEGENPLQNFGEHAPQHVKMLMTYPNSGDIVVNSLYNPQNGEVAAFEELVGSHGGLGGTQNQPFILYPAALERGKLKELVGAPAIYNLVKNWHNKLKDTRYKPTQLPAAPPGIPAGPRTRNISMVAILMAVIGAWTLLIGMGSLVSRYAGHNTESISHFLVPVLAGALSVSIGVGLWRLKHWALDAAICICAISIILSTLDLMLAPPQSRSLGGILTSIPVINTVVFAYFLYSDQVRRTFG